MSSSDIKYNLRPLASVNNDVGSSLSKKDQATLIQGVYFSKIEVVSRDKLLKKREIHGFPDFFSIFGKNKYVCDIFNKLNHQNKNLNKNLFKKKKFSLFGILNITPDSFSDGGTNLNLLEAIKNAHKMVDEGASFIDIGGESTRPGANIVSAEKEISRVMPVIQRLSSDKIDLSLDTRNSSTMEFGIISGVKIINDVSGLIHDKKSIDVIKKYNIPIVLMHMPGTPKTMMKKNKYSDVVLDVYDFLENRIDDITQYGINRENIIVDPGIGFGKNYEQNLDLIKNLSIFHSLGVPLMLGVSRKRFIQSISSESDPQQRLGGTISATISAIKQGIRIHRVHDVKEVNQALMVYERLAN